MTTTIAKTVTIEFEIRDCNGCQIKYGVPAGFEQARRDDHKTWYCPNGCARHYPQDNETEALRKKLHAATLEKERAERLTREAQAAEMRATAEAKRLQTRARRASAPVATARLSSLPPT